MKKLLLTFLLLMFLQFNKSDDVGLVGHFNTDTCPKN